MEFKLTYETILKLTNEEIISLFEQLTGYNLYTLSTSWRNSNEYILKLKGANGDVIINWN